jgi:2-methylcitrate dehydratase PrpD
MSGETPKVSDRLCEYAVSLRFEDLPAEVIERTKQLFIDFLACALGGHRIADSSGPITRGVAGLAYGTRGACTVVGEPDLYPPQYAALLNGAYAHSMDYDDIHRGAVMHPAVTVFPTLLALGEDGGASGKDFLTAAVVGYDVANKIGKAHGTFVHARGFHPTGTTGIFACTCAGASILGLPIEQTRNAFGMNISQTAGAQQYEVNGSWDKRIHTGLAAHNAILSLFLAREGYRGSVDPIEGKHGYFALYASKPLDAARVLDGLGTEFEVMNTAVKPYPCCRCSHAAIDAVIAFVRENNLKPGDIAAIDIDIGKYSYKIVGDPPDRKRTPANIVEAQFSQYFAAATAARGEYSWQSYALIDDPEVHDLMRRVTLHPTDDVPQYGVRVSLVTRDGRRLTADHPLPKGEPELPMTQEEFDAKFREWARPALGEANADRVSRLIASLESLETIAELTACLRLGPCLRGGKEAAAE